LLCGNPQEQPQREHCSPAALAVGLPFSTGTHAIQMMRHHQSTEWWVHHHTPGEKAFRKWQILGTLSRTQKAKTQQGSKPDATSTHCNYSRPLFSWWKKVQLCCLFAAAQVWNFLRSITQVYCWGQSQTGVKKVHLR
jgi:hypothetical protein